MSESNENDLSYIQAFQVAGLVHKLREKELLAKDEQDVLESWLGSDATHARLLEELLDRRQVTAELKAMAQYDSDHAVTAIFRAIGEETPPVIRPWKRLLRPLAVAASLLLLVGAGWWFFFLREGAVQPDDWTSTSIEPGYTRALLRLADGTELKLDSSRTQSLGRQGAALVKQEHGRVVYTAGAEGAVAYNTITTPPGGQYALQLADGSEVWLNAASSITYPTSFPAGNRVVTITGEAFFHVAKDKAKPFFVKARDMQVEVIGTAFNVMAYPDEDAIRATLVSGVVKAHDASHQVMTLQPGEQAALVNKSGQLRKEKPLLEEVTAWRVDTFRFHETNMATILRQVARWYDVKVEFRGAAADIEFSGSLSRKKDIHDLLEVLSGTRTVHFEIKDDRTIIVLPGPK